MTLVANENVVGVTEYIESSKSCYLIMEYCKGGDLEC